MNRPDQPVTARQLALYVFALVASAFTNIYITQPVLPVLAREFDASESAVSLTVSAVVIGIAIANLPFGVIADRYRLRPILLGGALVVGLAGMIGALTPNLKWLVALRLIQGLALPALMTCVAAYLARVLPATRLNVVMGAYVSATVAGGLGGRLLGGWLHPPTHWRYAMFSAAVLVMVTAVIAAYRLPDPGHVPVKRGEGVRFLDLLRRGEIIRPFIVAASVFFVFSSVFNYLPFRLAAPPLELATETITALYLTYVVGIFIGPLSGRFSDRFGNANTVMIGTGVIACGVLLTTVDSMLVIVAAMLLLCLGFFAVHSAATGALNSRVQHGKGRANALYVLFYYLGGFAGISLSGYALENMGWNGVVMLCLSMLLPSLAMGAYAARLRRR
jgi:YNFM family putative membrane transporter